MNRFRRSKAEMAAIGESMIAIAGEYPMTVRHLFYRMVGAGLIEKAELDYKGIVIRLAGKLRESGIIPWDHIIDESRWIRGVETYGNASDALAQWAKRYRTPIWGGLAHRPIVLVEKDAMAGHLADLCEEYDVPLLPVKGFCSKTYVRKLAEMAVVALENDQRTVVFIFGDHDPSGVAAPIGLEALMRRYMVDILGGEPIYEPWFTRLAVLPEQIEECGLPTRPVKTTDSRARGWDGGCVELDAMRPSDLQAMLEASLNALLPEGHMEAIREREEREIERLMEVAYAL